MKILSKYLIALLILLSSLLSQDTNLEMPYGNTKVAVMVEYTDSNLISDTDIESIVKLRLRRNGISVHANSDDRGEDGMLYIMCNIGTLQNPDAVYGSVSFSFIRNITFELGDAKFEKIDMLKYRELKGRGPIFNSRVWHTGSIFYNSKNSRNDRKEHIVGIIEKYVDNFSSDFLDANNL
tara:strand:- start:66 stop:605 length:540 start_codon:yes stop_codon:yes gene_type:complete